MSSWSIAAAKARFSALVEGARRRPQRITRRGKSVAVVMGIDEYERTSQAGAGPHPMRQFLALCDEMRGRGDIEFRLPRRRVRAARPSPFGGGR